MANELQQLIVERIRREGPITFADYMRMALYEPGYGYYVTGADRIGWEGDYYTSTDVSSFFAHCMGRQLEQLWEKSGRPGTFVVLEQGADRGHLAQGVRAWAEEEARDFNAALDYWIEDIRAGQDALADESAVGAINRPLRGYQAPSVILSNELIDAFPVHVVETFDKRLYEIFVGVEQGRFCEVLDEPSSEGVASYLDRYKIPWQGFGDGWRAEINLDALRWVERVAQLVQRGYILTIDYGDKAKALYTRYRRRGTLACYSQHHMLEHPYLRAGRQDITAHVNFSALIDEGRRHGFRLSAFTTQRQWLEGLGIYDELERRRLNDFSEADTARATDRGQVALLRWYNLRQRVAALTDAAGMGNFKVLLQFRAAGGSGQGVLGDRKGRPYSIRVGGSQKGKHVNDELEKS